MSFGDNLKRICTERGTTPSAILKKWGLSTSKVSAWYAGSLPKQDILVRLASELNCSVSDFFSDDKSTRYVQTDNRGNISNNTGSSNAFTTNNYFSNQKREKTASIESSSKERFFTIVDQLRRMNDNQLIDMTKYAAYLMSKDGK